MRIVLDTNVFISALIRPHSSSAVLLRLILGGSVTALIDVRILQEYEEVASRPKFEIDRGDLEIVLTQIRARGESILATPLHVVLPDPDDIAFLEVARSGSADAIVTGNKKHFPAVHRGPVEVLSPKEALDRLVGN